MIRKIVAVALLVVCLVGGALFLIVDPFYMRVPKDADMLRSFQAHIAAFEKLRDMVIEDGNVTAKFSATALNAGLSRARRDEYGSLFAQLPTGMVVASHISNRRDLFSRQEVFCR
jgi:hypothetical protein